MPNRDRCPNSPHRVPDLDAMTPEQLEDWAKPRTTLTRQAQYRFPRRPPFFGRASRNLNVIALALAAAKRGKRASWHLERAEMFYARLPRYAQWRRRIGVNVASMQAAYVRPKRRKKT